MNIAINSVSDLTAIAALMYKGGCMPKSVDRPEKLATIIMAGLDVGLTPTQAVGTIALIDGKPVIYGDGMMALVRASGLLERIEETVEGEGDLRAAICKVTRKGEQERVVRFSMADAKRAGLIERANGKGPWATYPDRMLTMRARGFAFRDVFADVLRGLHSAEEVQDYAGGSGGEAGGMVVDVQATAAVATTAATAPQPALVSTPTAPTEVIADAVVEPVQPTNEDGPLLDSQLEELRRLFGIATTTHKSKDPREVILGYLTPFNAPNAKSLTSRQARELIAILIRDHDPFTELPATVPPTPAG